ncbi:MAG TPA: MBG domain-containing protein, partial [Anaerolineaceae bacterium]|nr:MBG domain-containing protein [Anaerolineaceae bacterium]
VTASQNGDANYNPASPVTRSFTISKANQSITFGSLSNKTYGDADFTVTATATSGLPVSFGVGSGDKCTVAGNLVHITGGGSCTVTARQAGNENYFPADDIPQIFTIAKGTVSIIVEGLNQTYDGNPKHVTVTTTPPVETVTVNYEGVDGTIYLKSTTPPTEKGRYTVTIEVNDPNYSGSATATLIISDPKKFVYLPLVIR